MNNNTWETPVIVEEDVKDTQYAGDFSNSYDQTWQDDNGAWHANYVPNSKS